MTLDQIDKILRILAEEGVTQPILGYSFVKIRNIPPELAYLLELTPDELELDETLAPLIALATKQAETVNSDRNKVNVLPKIIIRQGSLILIIGIVSPLTSLFKEEIRVNIFKLREKVEAYFKDPESSSYNLADLSKQAHHLYQTLSIQLNKSNSSHQRKAQSLKDATIDVLALVNSRDVFAHGRLGLAQNLDMLIGNFTAARASNRPIELRLIAIKIARNQAMNLYESLAPQEDKEFLLNLLILRLSGASKIVKEKLNEVEKEFNKEVEAIICIVEKLKNEVETEV